MKRSSRAHPRPARGRPQRPRRQPEGIAVSILAGGLGARMGRDKAALRLGGRSLLAIIRGSARAAGWSVRVIRRDLVPRCGPLGGIHAALATGRAEAELFLACDMPFVSQAWLRTVTRALRSGRMAVFSGRAGVAGFPCIIRRTALPAVVEQIASGDHSLQALARVLRARLVRIPAGRAAELFNINTPADWAAALQQVSLA